MKFNHNKKRNTAFIYEVLVIELSKASMHENLNKKDQIIKILKEFFTKGKLLKKDLEIYRSFENIQDIGEEDIEKILSEAKRQYSKLNRKLVFNTQTRLINEVNKNLGYMAWNNFISSYKNLATLNQVFSQVLTPKKQILMEKKLIENLLKKREVSKPFPNINNLAVKTFVERFNNQYLSVLNPYQKTFLGKYISSSKDSGLEFKAFLYEEIDRLKKILKETVEEDKNIDNNKIQQIVDRMSSYNKRKIDKSLVSEVIKIQSLVSEITSNGIEN